MATAKAPGGLYYVGGVAVDAEGKVVEGAPPRPADTELSQQAVSLSSEDRLAVALAKAFQGVQVGLRPAPETAPETAPEKGSRVGKKE